MATGYLVTLGDGTLDAGDAISGAQSTFDIDTTLGNGAWTWSGVWDGNGNTYNNITDTGVFYEGTDGSVYFIPDNWFTTSGTATVTTTPADGTVQGTSGNDLIDDDYEDDSEETVTDNGDIIDAGAGDDTVLASDGTDVVYGGTGDDVLLGQRGDDTVFGGNDNDGVYGGGGNDSLDGGTGDDTIYGGSGTDTIQGANGVDTLFGGSGNDTLDGGNAGDLIRAGSGDDTIVDTGGTGSADTIFGESGDDSIDAGLGNDIVSGGSGSDTIDGGDGVDTIEGNEGDDSILGGDGNDVLIGDTNDVATPASEALNWTGQGAAGTDLNGAFSQNTGGVTVSVEVTDDGNADRMEVSTNAQYTETGEPFNANSALILTGGAGATATAAITFDPNLDTGLSDEVENVSFRINDIDTNGWQDIVTVNAFDADGNIVNVSLTPAVVTGTASDDTVSGNTITAGSSSESASNAEGSVLVEIAGPVHQIEIIYANGDTATQALWVTDIHFDTAAIEDTENGNDTIDGGSGADYIEGNGGDDSIVGGTGADTIYAGEGNDVVGSFDDEDGADTIFGGAGNDSLNGGDGDDLVYGGTGSDTITGGSDNDSLFGGDGSDAFYITDDHEGDVIEGGEDADGSDIDTVSFFNFETTEGVSVTATGAEEGTYDFDGSAGTGSYSEIEELNGTSYDDTFDMSADGSGVSIDANGGADSIIGGSGDDVIETGGGADTVSGGAGNDTINLGTGGTSGDGDADVVVLQDGFGDDVVSEFDAPTDNGDGTFTGIDMLDVTGLNDAGGVPVNTSDVVVTDDGSGNALLSFPNGETITLIGISPTDADNPVYLNAIGIPMPDGTVEGTSGADTIDAGYTGDPDTDMVDAGDAILAGDTGDDDLIEAYGGTDSVSAGAGEDEVYGGLGSDTIDGGTGGDTLYGGATDEVANLIVNGSFEDLTGTTDTTWGDQGTGSIVGWTDYNGGEFDLHDNGKGGTFATDGTHVLDMGGTPDNLHIYQDISGAVTGETYALTLDAGDVTGGGNSVEVYWGGELIATIDPVEGGMESFAFELIGGAGDGANRLEFKEIGPEDVDGVQLDNIQLIGVDGNAATQDTSGDSITGGAGDDTVYGLQGNDTLDGGADDDTVSGGQGSDDIQVSAAEGSDSIIGGEDADGLDLDTLDFTDGTGPAGVDVVMGGDEDGTYTFPTDGGDGTFSEIEAFDLTDQNDSFDGSLTTTGTTVSSGAGDDTLTGGSGADSLSAGSGDDILTFGEGDTADGGSGDDLFVLEDLGGPDNGTITIDGGAGDETGGDTLQLGNLGVLTQDVIDSFVDDGTGSYSGSITLDDGTILNFSEIENIICFTPGTRIATPHGLRAVEDLEVGDLVVTRDHGLQPIRWVEGRTVPAIDRFAPVRIRSTVLAGQQRDLVVSPQHRVLFQGYRAELLFGESEVLVSAKHLVDGMDVTQDTGALVTYVHMMFDQHEIIFAEGAATESFHPGDIGFSAVSDAAREELFAIFPELRADQMAYGNTARRCLKGHEAKLIRM